MDKAGFRQWSIQKLTDTDDAVRSAGTAAVIKRLRELPEFQSAPVIGGYLATPKEFDLSELWQEIIDHRKLAIPAEHHQLRCLLDLEALERNSFGVMQPANAGICELADSDVLIMPGLAYDQAGYRLGHGTGYFDRLLATMPPGLVTIGVCYDWQVVDELPHMEYDRPVSILLTPEQTLDLR